MATFVVTPVATFVATPVARKVEDQVINQIIIVGENFGMNDTNSILWRWLLAMLLRCLKGELLLMYLIRLITKETTETRF